MQATWRGHDMTLSVSFLADKILTPFVSRQLACMSYIFIDRSGTKVLWS